MKKFSNREMIDSLARFRESGDKLSEGVFELSSLLLSISTEIEQKPDKTPEEQAIFEKISSNSELIVNTIMHANEYNNSLWVDYTPVIKHLGGESVKK